ncbi:uncharacterized protein LOC132789511 [Drosophila nasuta]|uniref:uncharacterized protein LOC132789511 n=1 Tax=Drosophila nasuta TaxID=42062 RepID=UPI00295E4F18|nr:uncharacterized protein LOC132789511 [Drosophila nasuta]
MKNDKYLPPEPAAPPAFGFSSAPPEGAQNYPPPSYSQHAYPPQGPSTSGFSSQAYPPQGPPAHGYPPQAPLAHGYPPQGHPEHGYPPQGPLAHGYPPRGPPAYGYPPQGHSQSGYPPQQDFPQQVYSPQGYPPQGYTPQAYPPQSFAPPGQVYAQPAQHYVPPPPPPPPPTILLVRPSGWYQRTRLNRPQMNVLSAATFIFATGGMNIAWSIGFRHRIYDRASDHVRVAWFIGAIIGAAVAAFLPKVIPRRLITIFCSTLVLIGGIVTWSSFYSVDAVLANLYLNGIANGLAFAPTVALAGELAVFYMRGKITASTEQLSFNLGIFLQIIVDSTYIPDDYDFAPEYVNGIITTVFGFVGLVMAAIMFVESPVTLVATGREQAATDALRRLQRPFLTAQEETLAQLEEHKRYVTENTNMSSEESFSQAIPAFLKLTAIRCISAISISSFFVEILFLANRHSYYWNDQHALIFGAARLLGSCIAALIVDSLGRKGPTVVGLAGTAIFACVAASQSYYSYRDAIFWLYFFQLFAGLAFTMTSAYLSEAYPLKVKQHFLSFTFILEMVIFIIMGLNYLIDEFQYIVGGICAGAFFISILCLPETRRTTLRIAQQRFRSFISTCNNS